MASKKTAPSHGKPKLTPRPSDKLNPKTIDPFASQKVQSNFAAAYGRNSIPCRLVHGSVKHKLTWEVPPETLPFDPLLITLADGIRETIHPYSFVARRGFAELLATPDSEFQAIEILPRLIMPIKMALMHKDSEVFDAGLAALSQISDTVCAELNPHLKNLLVPIAKRMMQAKHRDAVTTLLQKLDYNGGQAAAVIIKAKIPTYTSLQLLN